LGSETRTNARLAAARPPFKSAVRRAWRVFDKQCQVWQITYVLAQARGDHQHDDDQRDHNTAVQVEEFRLALAAGEVVLHFQPQVDLRNNLYRGAEALIRWDHPDGGLLPPSDFLPALTHSTLMPVITGWVIRQACTKVAATPGMCVAVNIAATDACDPTLVDSVRSALRATALEPERLTLELTEDALVQDIDRATQNLRLLADDGVMIALDDFGTGYSSMLYLRVLPIT
jgi:EAL domain-containing protein (putative c-di-GMP-specific phosphodiesterase class I)